MAFRSLTKPELEDLVAALRGNGEGNRVLLTNRDTGFLGTTKELPNEEVINAIKSVPSHY
jgi:hypothetical protein